MKTNTAQISSNAGTISETGAKFAFAPVLAATTLALFFLQPSLAISASAAVCLSFAMAALSVGALFEDKIDLGRSVIRLIAPVFAGLVVWLAALAGQSAGDGMVWLTATMIALPAILLCEGLLSVFVIGALSRISDRPIDAAAAVLVANKYSGLAGNLR